MLVISESKGYKHKMKFDPFNAMSVGWKKLCCNIGASFAPVTLNPQCNYPHVAMLNFAISLMASSLTWNPAHQKVFANY